MPRFTTGRFLRLLALGGLIATIPVASVLAESHDDKNKQEIYQLMKEKGYRCLECHDVEAKVVGPSWKEVSAARKDDAWPKALITYKLSEGAAGDGHYRGSEASSGNYGTQASMPHHEISDEDAQRIASWILGLDESRVRLTVENSKDQKVKPE